MRFLGVVLVICYLLSGQNALGLHMEWDAHRQSRKLLLSSGEDVSDKDDKMFQVSAGGNVKTGIVLKNKIIGIPGTHNSAKINNVTLAFKSGKGGFSFFEYKDAKEAFADYFTGTPAENCFVFGFVGSTRKKIAAVIDNSKVITLKSPKFCDTDSGAALVCDNKLAGIVYDKRFPSIPKNVTGGGGPEGPAPPVLDVKTTPRRRADEGREATMEAGGRGPDAKGATLEADERDDEDEETTSEVGGRGDEGKETTSEAGRKDGKGKETTSEAGRKDGKGKVALSKTPGTTRRSTKGSATTVPSSKTTTKKRRKRNPSVCTNNFTVRSIQDMKKLLDDKSGASIISTMPTAIITIAVVGAGIILMGENRLL